MKWKMVVGLTLAISIGAFFVGRSSNAQRDRAGAANPAAVNITAVAERGTDVGNLAPDFQVTQLDGSTLSLADLRGQPAVLVFWASWCQYCREEATHINKLADDYAARGVRVFGINVRESHARTETGIKDFGIRYSVVRDTDGKTARDYNVEGIPTILILDSKATVRYVGNAIPSDYAQRLDTLLAEK